jgi:hypothetical protein
LSRSEQLVGGLPDFFVVENQTVHCPILPPGMLPRGGR